MTSNLFRLPADFRYNDFNQKKTAYRRTLDTMTAIFFRLPADFRYNDCNFFPPAGGL
jgi:hypothetical protein